MNTSKIVTIMLNEHTVDDLGRWSRTLKNNPIPASPPFDEAVLQWEINMKGVGDVVQLHYRSEEDTYQLQLSFDDRPYTKWTINKQIISKNSFGIVQLPNTVNDLELIQTMTSVWANALSFIEHNEDNNKLVIRKQIRFKKLKKGKKQSSIIVKNIIELNIPDELSSNQEEIDYEKEINKTYKEGVSFEALELNPNESLKTQIESQLDNYYKEWLNMSLPALKGKTPLEAAKTESGKEDLEKLFAYIKKMPSPVPFPEKEIRKTLGV